MNQFKRLATRSAAAVSVALLFSAGATASVITGNLSVDNGFSVYVSTDDTVAGTLLGSAEDWGTTYSVSGALTAGTDYFLHIRAYDMGGIAAALATFSVTGGHHFANGGTTLSTNTAFWMGNQTGFTAPYATLTDVGMNGAGPWGWRPNIAADAHWIWAGNPYDNDTSYLTTRIMADAARGAVPEPSSIGLLGLGLLGMASLRRKAGRNKRA